MTTAGYPYHYSVTKLDAPTESTFVQRILEALEFQHEFQPEPVGLSGLRHHGVVLGRNEERRHVVVVPAGFDRAHEFGLPRAVRGGDPPGVEEWQRLPLLEKEVRVLRGTLLAAYDLRALYENQGWACDVLYFLNIASSEDSPRLRGIDGLRVQTQSYGSTHEIAHHPLAELRRYAISTGTALISLGDFQTDELTAICGTNEAAAQASAQHALRRLRVSQFFRPPADELILGAVHAAEKGLSDQELVTAVETSARFRHPLAENELLAGVDRDDPIDVAKALAREKYIQYKGGVSYPLEGGGQVWHSIKTTPQESWIRLLVRLLSVFRISV